MEYLSATQGESTVSIPLEEVLARTRQRLDARVARDMGPLLGRLDRPALRSLVSFLSRAATECLAEAICDCMAERT